MRRFVMACIVLWAAAAGCRDCWQTQPCTPYPANCYPYSQAVRVQQAAPVYAQQQGCVPCRP